MQNTPLELSLLSTAADLYRAALARSRRAQDCLKTLGLTDPAMLEHFRVGYCGGEVLRKWADTEEKQRQLQELRLLTGRGQEFLKGCLTVPLLDTAGQVAGLYGWRLRCYVRDHRHQFVRMASGHCRPEAVQAGEPVLLVEGVLDVLACWQAGIGNALALKGAYLMTGEQQLLLEGGVQKVLLATDDNLPGETGARWTAEQLTRAGLTCYRVRLGMACDPLSYFRGGTPKTFQQLVDNAQPMRLK